MRAIEAKSADSFVDTIGVNVHLRDTTYNLVYDEIIRPRLLELGVRHIRDSAMIDQPRNVERYADLAGAGIKTCFATTTTNGGSAADHARWAVDLGPNVCDGFEGLNEPDNKPLWALTAIQWQHALWRAFKGVYGEPPQSTRAISILNMSIYKEGSASQIAELMRYFEVANIHPYPGGIEPELYGGALDWHIANIVKPISPDAPIWATETGYHNALDRLAGHRGTSEEAAATYMPRIFLHYFNRGIERTYGYELYDQGSDPENVEGNFGLVRNGGSPKPAFKAMRNLIAMLADPGPKFSPGSLSYEAPHGVETTLLQKHDGTFYLAAWLPAHVWDQDLYRDIEVPPRNVTFYFDERIDGAAIAMPNTGIGWTEVSVRQEIDVEVSPKVTLLRLSAR